MSVDDTTLTTDHTKDPDSQVNSEGLALSKEKGLSLSALCIHILQSEPERTFVIKDFVDRTGADYDNAKRTLSRLASTRKGSGPVRRLARGMYQYAPEKEQDGLQRLVQSGYWRIENIVLVKTVPSETQSIHVSPARDTGISEKGIPIDRRIPINHSNVPYPEKLPTGQAVTWQEYGNGTEIIRISSNGAPPLSPDAVLLIFRDLRRFGLDGSWKCTSIEINMDSQKLRIDASYTYQILEGVLLKVYQHGYNGRIEIADRRKMPIVEVISAIQNMAEATDGKVARTEIKDLRARLERCEWETKEAMIASKKAEKFAAAANWK